MKTFKQFMTESSKESSSYKHVKDMLANKNLSPNIRSGYEHLRDREEKLHKMSADKHIEKLEKTRKSIQNHVVSGGSYNSARADDLRTRYDSHADHVKDLHPDHWKHYNEKHKTDPRHNASDLFA